VALDGQRLDGQRVVRRLFQAALHAVAAETRLPPHLPEPPPGRTLVVGAGKAAADMARVVDAHWSGELSGLVVTRYEHSGPPERRPARIEIAEAGHPLPDAAGEYAARRILELAAGLGADDLLLCLISGGGSALLALPAPGLSLADKRAINQALLRSGATIAEINCVRKHLSAIKGGRLALAALPARVVTLAVSDVPGDDPAVIASGPTVADPTTAAEALLILAKYHIEPPPGIISHLTRSHTETPKPGDPRLARLETVLIARPQDALEAAAAEARALGLAPLILGNALEGEAREVGRVHAGIVRQCLIHGQPVAPPCVLLSGGETTVTVRGRGWGGRNTEFLLALGLALGGAAGVHALACDTDGIDGMGRNAGAVLYPDTLVRAAARGLDAANYLANNDAGAFFAALGDLVVTGPTLTNVNDFRAVLIDPDGRVVNSARLR
jgi:hydroxypyruvate reductase